MKPTKLFQFILLITLSGLISVGCEQVPKKSKEVVVTGSITENTLWKSDTNYIIDQLLTVEKGATLTIEAGSVIKANPGEAPSVSMLLIAKGGKLIAKGTADAPIVFTSVNDTSDKKNNFTSQMSSADVGLWGGIIILGDAPVSLPDDETETFYTGLNPNNKSSYYGGQNADDSSGEIEYLSIRHGGIYIGTGSESNGLTLCGVGAKTNINHVEIFANQDDGIEFFGGTVNVSNLIIHASGDDGIDIDEGYQGTISNFLVELGEISDSALEISGGKGEFKGDFKLIDGIIDGQNHAGVNVYKIDQNAQGTISHMKQRNFPDSANKNNDSEKVTIEESEVMNAEFEKQFNWARSKQK